jgi:cytochrome c peroxidase
MKQLRASAAVFVSAILLFTTQNVSAAPPRVPSLPTQLAEYVKYAVTDLPNHYKSGPVAATNNTPVNNPTTDAGATLGRVLFYDTRMSHGDGVACASCHQQQHGFSDPDQFSTGFDGELTGRHSMSITNAVYYANGKAFWDERATSLEDQALQPIQSPVEMGMTLPVLVEKLSQTDFYPKLFNDAFGTPEITPERIGKAIAQFERAMVSYKSKYDQAIAVKEAGNTNPMAVLSPTEYYGETLFHGSGRCSQCHTTAAQVGDAARNVGLDATNPDIGAGDGKFKTTSLRNVAVRGRFMHDGRFSSLEEVIEFYNSGVQANPNLDNRLKNAQGQPLRLNLDATGVAALVAFLNTLTDTEFLNDAKFSDPFVALPGDYNGDGTVDTDDYVVWKTNFGDISLLTADGNGDGRVDAADYTFWRDNMGGSWLDLAYGGGNGAASLGVPEPASLMLLLVGTSFCATLRRRSVRILQRPS